MIKYTLNLTNSLCVLCSRLSFIISLCIALCIFSAQTSDAGSPSSKCSDAAAVGATTPRVYNECTNAASWCSRICGTGWDVTVHEAADCSYQCKCNHQGCGSNNGNSSSSGGGNGSSSSGGNGSSSSSSSGGTTTGPGGTQECNAISGGTSSGSSCICNISATGFNNDGTSVCPHATDNGVPLNTYDCSAVAPKGCGPNCCGNSGNANCQSGCNSR